MLGSVSDAEDIVQETWIRVVVSVVSAQQLVRETPRNSRSFSPRRSSATPTATGSRSPPRSSKTGSSRPWSSYPQPDPNHS
ncbi:hypothetical protein [Microbacterium sp. NPDC087868]|uniref:hypothetical protein n=1 Tax=Microbacterium sp. NPDC087868 TaxID=3364195 RepID=UPI00384CFCCD